MPSPPRPSVFISCLCPLPPPDCPHASQSVRVFNNPPPPPAPKSAGGVGTRGPAGSSRLAAAQSKTRGDSRRGPSIHVATLRGLLSQGGGGVCERIKKKKRDVNKAGKKKQMNEFQLGFKVIGQDTWAGGRAVCRISLRRLRKKLRACVPGENPSHVVFFLKIIKNK